VLVINPSSLYKSFRHYFWNDEQEKNYSKENEVSKMDRLLGFVKEPLIEREVKLMDMQPKKWYS